MTDADLFYERPLPPEEFERRVTEARSALDGPEGDEIRAHVRWFLRRYPTPLSRLVYARRKYEEAIQTRGLALSGKR